MNECNFLSCVMARCCGCGDVSTAWNFWDPHKQASWNCSLLPLSSLWETIFRCVKAHGKGARGCLGRAISHSPRICKFFFFPRLWGEKLIFLLKASVCAAASLCYNDFVCQDFQRLLESRITSWFHTSLDAFFWFFFCICYFLSFSEEDRCVTIDKETGFSGLYFEVLWILFFFLKMLMWSYSYVKSILASGECFLPRQTDSDFDVFWLSREQA